MSTLISMKNGERRSLRFWQGLSVAALISIPIASHHATVTALQPLRIAVMDGAGAFYFSKLGTFKDAEQIHVEAAKSAATVLLTWNPEGLENKELSERLFWDKAPAGQKSAKEQLDQWMAVNKAEFQKRQIHQWIETSEIKQIQREDNSVSVSVSGQLINRGLQGGRFVDTPRDFEVYFDLHRNSDMASNGMCPLVVTHYQVVKP